MKILLGSDHRGFELKGRIKAFLETLGYEVLDTNPGALNPEDDYPQIVSKFVPRLLAIDPKEQRGILICSSGQGVNMAANRFKGIRSCLCWNEAEAKSSRNDDDSNVLCLSADQMDYETSTKVITVWLNSEFAAAPRFIRRIKELDDLG